MAAWGTGVPAGPAAAMAVGPGRARWAAQSSHCTPRTLRNLLSLLYGPVTMAKVPLSKGPYTEGRCHCMVWPFSYTYATLTRALCSMPMHSWSWSPSYHHHVTALRYKQRIPMDTCRGRSLHCGPSCAGASTSVLHTQESREGRGSATACAQKVSGAQLLALSLAFLWVSAPLPLAHSSFSVLPVFFAGETRRLGPTGPARIGWSGLGSGSSGLVSAYLQGSLLITDTATHGETPGPHSDHEGNYSLPLARPDSSATHLMPARAGELRKGRPAKQPWAGHTRVKITLTCMHPDSPCLCFLSPSSFKSDI